MLSANLVAPFRIELVEQERPSLGPREVRIRVTDCGVCASDVDFWQGKSERTMPAPLGHEPAGVVVEVGRDVTTLTPGTKVACWVEGGGFSEEVVTSERFCMPIATDCPHPEVAEPLGCVVNAVELAAPALADDVVIIGAGFMGNLLQLVVQLRGPRSVTVVDIRPAALERANRLGATATIDAAREDVAARIAEATDGRGADLSFEVTGASAGLALAEQSTRMSGKLCIVGYHQGGTREIRLGYWNWMAFNIVNAHFRRQETILAGMRSALRLIEAKALDVTPLITNSYPLERIDDAFKDATSKSDGFVKAVVQPTAVDLPE